MSAATAASGQNAYNRALAAYTQHLTAKERARISAPTSLSDLISQAQAIVDDLDKKRKKSSTLRTFGKTFWSHSRSWWREQAK